MNILILMAGSDEAFREAGYAYPKNLIEVDGLPIVQKVLASLAVFHTPANKFICLLRKDENKRSYTSEVVRLLLPGVTVLEVPDLTAGAACTALLAIEQINNTDPLLIVNGDQVIEGDLGMIVTDFQQRGLDGGITVFEAVHPRWSYVKCDEQGLVVETAEKRPISNLATAGMYYFARGKDFVTAAMAMIKKDAQVEGVFYVCPAYNELILRQAAIGIYKIARSNYFSLSSPTGLQAYEEHLRRRY